MFIGAIFFIGGVILTIISYLVLQNNGYFIICTGAILFGFARLLMGLVQYANGNKQDIKQTTLADITMMNIAKYGVEEPRRTWECPSCKATNPNTTYKCTNCGLSLI